MSVPLVSLSNSKVLIVDDARTHRLLLKKVLRLFNIEAKEAENGIEAIAQWQRWQPHLIFMDLLMPDMDGATAVHRIRQQTHGDEVIIIAYTAGLETEQEKVAIAECDGILQKPCKPQEIEALLEKHLQILITA